MWDQHLQVALNPAEGFVLTVSPGALVTVNQTPLARARLQNGDLITAGAAQLCFRLRETCQQSLRLREALVWAMVVGVLLGEAALIGWMLQ